MPTMSKPRIPLREWQHPGRLAGQQHAAGTHFVGLRIHFVTGAWSLGALARLVVAQVPFIATV